MDTYKMVYLCICIHNSYPVWWIFYYCISTYSMMSMYYLSSHTRGKTECSLMGSVEWKQEVSSGCFANPLCGTPSHCLPECLLP